MNKTLLFIILFSWISSVVSADVMSNVYGRSYQFLNGKWSATIDWYGQREPMHIFENKKSVEKTDLNEENDYIILP